MLVQVGQVTTGEVRLIQETSGYFNLV